MMDRAWTRLQAMPDDPDSRQARQRLTIRMFLDRGWHERASDRLAEALAAEPGDPELLRLLARAERPPVLPPLEVPPITAPHAQQLAAAEAFLRSGAFLKARLVLEALDRLRPGDRRVMDLLWALQGDYDLAGTTLQHVAARYGGATRGAVDRTSEVALELPEPASFVDEEDTQAMRLADLDSPASSPFSYDTNVEDTAVLRVVGQDFATDPATVPDARSTDIEDEDDVVVMVRKRDERPPPRTMRPLPSPRPVPRPSRQPIVEAGDLQEVDEADYDEADYDEADFEEVDTEAVDEAAAPARTSPLSVGLLVGAAALLGASGLGLLLAVLWVSQHQQP